MSESWLFGSVSVSPAFLLDIGGREKQSGVREKLQEIGKEG